MQQTANVKVKGMTCENCVKHVKEALEAQDGVTEVNVSLSGGGKTSFTYDDSKVSIDQIKTKINDMGYKLKTGIFG